MFQIRQNESTASRKRAPILLVDATDGFTAETGVTSPTITISKNGAAGIGGTGTFSEVGNGVYSYEFAASEIDTLGWIALNVRKAGVTRDYNAIVQIMAYDYADVVNLGLTSLPEAAIGTTGALLTSYTSNGSLEVTSTGAVTQVSNIIQPVEITAGSGISVAYDVWNYDITGIGSTNLAGGALEAAAGGSAGAGCSTAQEVAFEVWSYDISGFSQGNNSAGERLFYDNKYVWEVDMTTLSIGDYWQAGNKLNETYNAVYDPAIPGVVIGDRVWTYNTGTGNSAAEQLNLAATGGAGVSATLIADAVWSSTTFAAAGSPSAGYYLDNINTEATAAASYSFGAQANTGDIGGTVWATDISAYTVPSAGGELLNAGAGSGGSSAIEVAQEVWSYSSGRTITGGTGVTLATALPTNFSSLSINGSGYVTTTNPGTGSTATPQQIAQAVWEENVVGVGDTTSAAVYLTNVNYTVGNIENYVANQTPQDIWTYSGLEGRTVTGGTGVTITQAFPANFATLAIDGSGYVTYNNAGSGTSSELADAVWNYDISSSTQGNNSAGDRLYYDYKYIWEADFGGLSIGDYWQAGNKLSEVYNTLYDPSIPGVILGDRVWSYNTGTGASAAEQLNLAAIGTGSSSAVQVAEEVWAYATRDITGGTIDTNNDKTGYSLTQTFPANFEDLSITATTGLVTTSNPGTGSTATPQDVAAATWAYATRETTGGIINNVTNPVGISTTSVDSITTSVWSEDISGYSAPSAGYDLSNVNAGSGGSSAVEIAGAVWSYNTGTGASAAGQLNTAALGQSTQTANAVWSAATRTITGGTITTVSDKTGYSLTQSFPANFATLAINGSGEVTTSNPGTGSTATPQDIAAATWGYSSGRTITGGIGVTLATALPSNFSLLAINGSGYVTSTNAGSGSSTPAEIAAATWAYATRTITGGSIDTNNDKTGYSLTQSFPTNFASLAINGSGYVTVTNPGTGSSSPSEIASAVWSAGTRTITGGTITTVSDKTGYSLTQSFPSNFALLSINGSGYVTSTNAGSGSSSPAEIAQATWEYATRTITGGTGVTLATALPSNFSTLNIDGSGKVSVQSADITTIKSGLSTLTQAQVGTEVDSSLSDVGLTTTVTGRIDSAISSRLASASAPANFADMSITPTTGYVSIGQTVPSASAVSTAVWTANRSAIGPSSGQFGYFLDARVSQAGGGAVTTVQLGPFDLRASDGVNGYLDVLVDDERTIAVAITDDNGNPIPLDSANTHNVLVYDANSTLVATYAATVEYEAGGAASFFLDTDVTGTAGTYKCVFDIDNGSYISKYGGLTILVKLC